MITSTNFKFPAQAGSKSFNINFSALEQTI